MKESHRTYFRVRVIVFAVLLGVLIAGCGGSGTASERSTGSTATSPSSPDDSSSESTRDAGAAMAPDLRLLRELQALEAAFKPASSRINFVVAAETLRQAAIESPDNEAAIVTRSGVLRIEIRRYRVAATQAKTRLVAAAPSNDAAVRVRDDLQLAIAARVRAIFRMQQMLDAAAQRDNERAARLAVEWRSFWDESLRLTRSATTKGQAARAQSGLEPAEEGAFR